MLYRAYKRDSAIHSSTPSRFYACNRLTRRDGVSPPAIRFADFLTLFRDDLSSVEVDIVFVWSLFEVIASYFIEC